MKFFFALCCFLTTAMLFPGLAAGEWYTDFEKAKAEALKTRRPIYILFTNSDSAVSLSYDRTIFSQKKFQDYADKKLVLMKVDFPVAIHLQSRALQQQNRQLRTQFKISTLPTALLLDANGNRFVDFIEKDGNVEKHRKKINEIMSVDPPKQYSEYLDQFVKKYTPPDPAANLSEKKTGVKSGTKTSPKKPAKKPDKKPDGKQQSADTNIPEENAGTPLVPLDPEGNFQDWFKAATEEGASKEEKAVEEAKEIVEEEKEALEAAERAEKTEAASSSGEAE